MDDRTLDHGRPHELAALFDVDGKSLTWRAEDLSAMFRHQLEAPVAPELRRLGARGGTVEALLQPMGGVQCTFADLFTHPRPPVELLRLVKDFAKTCDKFNDRPLPAEIALTLYYGAIAVALVRHGGTRISGLGLAELAEGMRWALAKPWLDQRAELVMSDALRRLTSDSPASVRTPPPPTARPGE